MKLLHTCRLKTKEVKNNNMSLKYPPLEFWEHFKKCNGAMSTAEAIFMYNACLKVPDEGVWVEMGTAHGKSALVSLIAWIERSRRDFYLLEPEFKKEHFLKDTYSNIEKLMLDFKIKTFLHLVDYYSTDFLPKFNEYSYIMWDTGSHGHELVSKEKPLLEDKIIKGGILVMHDINSQFIACTEAYNELINSGKYEPLLYDWQEIFDYVTEHNLEEGNNSWHLYPELPHPPNFIGALRRK